VPPMVIDQRFGRGVVIQEAFNNSWSTFYGVAVQENHLSPLAQPDLEVTKLEDGDLIEFTAEVDVRPDFELPDFSGLRATVDALEVPDSLVDSQVAALQQRFGSRETVERPAVEGDVVTIRLVASRDGEPLPDATADDVEYTVGSGRMLEGLDEAVTGLSAGESSTFSSTLVGGPLSGEPADIDVTLTKVQAQELPEADDELAQQASEFDTMAELRADIAERLTQVARLEQASQARDAVLEALLDQLEIDAPDNLLSSEMEARREQINRQLSQAGLTLEDYLAESEEGQSAEEFWADVEQRATQAIKAQMVLDKVAEERAIRVDQNDLTQHILRKAQADGVSPQQVADHLKEHPHHVEEYMLEIRRAKALALVVESVSVTDSGGATVELATLTEDGTYADRATIPDASGSEEQPTD
jgi:trigger factor